MKTSMKAGDADRTGVLRLLRGALKNDEIKLGHELSEEEVQKVLAREAKQRRDSIEAYRSASRNDLAEHEEMELGVISEYLPAAPSQADVERLADEVIEELGATDSKQMGAVIGAVLKKAGPGADGGLVSKVVRERLRS
jgi:hypothetical protein